MTALIKITETNGQRAVNARDLHQFLGVGRDFSNWIKGRIEEYQFIKGQDFEVFMKFGENSSGGRPAKEYALSLDMAKELSMVERTERGRRARRYFIEMEKIAHAKRIGAPKFQRTNINSVSVKRVMVDKVHNTDQADKVVKALYERAMQNKNQVLFSYQEMIDMLRN